MGWKQSHSPVLGRRAAWCRSIFAASTVVLLATLFTGCGGGGGAATPQASNAQSPSGTLAAGKTALSSKQQTGSLLSLAGTGATDPGMLLLLVPDGTPANDSRVDAWRDAALETGVRITPVTDSEFMAMGTSAYRYGGLVLPDTLHTVASDEVITAVRSYVQGGGRAMLVYDFGALYESGGNVFYAPVKSRLSDLAGVDYILYDELRDFTIGIGPVTAMRSTMRQLQVPPGKSMAYTSAQSASVMQLGAASDSAFFLPASSQDPGGVSSFDFQQYSNVPAPGSKSRYNGTKASRNRIDLGKAKQGPPVKGRTDSTPRSSIQTQTQPSGTTTLAAAATSEPEVLDAYSGYYYGYLSYPSYVTRGSFAGTVLATSPAHGLVAGVNTVGTGTVLFVNMPVTHLKGQTDALPMHGFLHYFALQIGRSAFLSPMPDGIAGMNFNWHFDGKDAQRPALLLEQRGIFKSSTPFSIHMTAGPDVVSFGDGLGWDLNNNTTAQRLLRRLSTAGHDVGSHGGWIHDYYGINASETNEAEFLQYLQWNRQAVDTVIRKASRSYSAPEGNNPTWAMNWLEQQGVVAAYFLGHTGLGVTRHYRNGVLNNPNLYVIPLTPFGLNATFEEFQEKNLPKQDVIDWYHALVDFNVEHNTNRMIYAHPPGAYQWVDVLENLLAYANSKGPGAFRWYTMAQLADHMTKRAQVTWSETVDTAGVSVFQASHPSSLSGMAWRLPKAAYQLPVVTSGSATVSDEGASWQVRPTGPSVTFQAARM